MSDEPAASAGGPRRAPYSSMPLMPAMWWSVSTTSTGVGSMIVERGGAHRGVDDPHPVALEDPDEQARTEFLVVADEDGRGRGSAMRRCRGRRGRRSAGRGAAMGRASTRSPAASSALDAERAAHVARSADQPIGSDPRPRPTGARRRPVGDLDLDRARLASGVRADPDQPAARARRGRAGRSTRSSDDQLPEPRTGRSSASGRSAGVRRSNVTSTRNQREQVQRLVDDAVDRDRRERARPVPGDLEQRRHEPSGAPLRVEQPGAVREVAGAARGSVRELRRRTSSIQR